MRMGLRDRAEKIIATESRQRAAYEKTLTSEGKALVQPEMVKWSEQMGLVDVPQFTVTDLWSIHEGGDGDDVTSVNITFEEDGLKFLGKLVVAGDRARSFEISMAGSAVHIRSVQDLAKALREVGSHRS
jgi:hypothetical protein